MYSIHDIIKSRRQQLNLTQKELANQINVSDKLISKWETGQGQPDLSLIKPLSVVLKLHPEELLQLDDLKGDESRYSEKYLLSSPYAKKQKNQITLYNIISKISASFASMNKSNYQDTVNRGLKLLGEFVTADRAYIFKYDFKKGICANTFEWCSSGILPVIDDLQCIGLSDIPDWINTHLKGEALYIPNVFQLPFDDMVRTILEPQGVKSLLTIPMYNNDDLQGFLGFDSVKDFRYYTEFEKIALFDFSNVLVNAISRMELENKVEQQNIKLEFMMDTSNIGVWEWHLPSGKTVFSEKWAEMIGYTLSEIESANNILWEKHIHPQDFKRAEDKIKKIISGEMDYFRCEFRVIHKKGNILWIRSSGKAIEFEKGRPVTLIGTHIDITDIKNRESELKVVKSAAEYSPVSIVITNPDMKVQFVNQAFTFLTEIEEEALLGGDIMEILAIGKGLNSPYRALLKDLNEGRQWKGELFGKKPDGKEYWQSLSVSPVFDENREITHYVFIALDITKDKLREQNILEDLNALDNSLKVNMQHLEDSNKAMVFALAKISKSRDSETGFHAERIQYLCKLLANKLHEDKKYADKINSGFINTIFYASALHDIGKIKVPDSILLKPGKLSAQEFDSVKQHVKYGSDTLLEIIKHFPDNQIIIMANKIAKYHHERWDGRGYLAGLKGEEIPLPARIMSVIDVYDALRTKRPYKEELNHKTACEIILGESGTHFDPGIVESFVSINEQIELVYESLFV